MALEIVSDLVGIAVLIGSALVVLVVTSIIHHLVGRITRWWNPRWASFLFSLVIGMAIQIRFIRMLEPLHIIIIIGNIVLIYLSAVGINALIGKPAVTFTGVEQAAARGIIKEVPTVEIKETWQTQWFD
jgi:hypothetical protein